MAHVKAGNEASSSYIVEHVWFGKLSDQSMIDVTSMFVDIDIIEGIERGFCEGSITMYDQNGIIETMEPSGEEVIHVSFFSMQNGVEQKRWEKLFAVGRIEHQESENKIGSVWVFHMLSIPEYHNEVKRVSRSFVNTSVHGIVKQMLDILQVDESQQNIENTIYNVNIVVPNISPVEVIVKMKESPVAQSGLSGSEYDSNFYFFENRDGVNFVSGSNLYAKEPAGTYNLGATQDITGIGRFMEWTKVRVHNVIDHLRSGGAGTTVHSLSLVNKNFKSVYMDFDAVKENYISLNARKAYTGDNNVRGGHQQYLSEDGIYSNMNNSSKGNTKAIGTVNKASAKMKMVSAVIAGNTDLTAGDNILVRTAKGEEYAKKNSDGGYWLIQTCRYQINRESFLMSLSLISDSNAVYE